MGRLPLQEKKSKRWLAVEKQFGKPMKALLPELFAKYGGRESVAEALGVNEITLDKWNRVCGYRIEVEQRSKLVPLAEAEKVGCGE